MDKIKIMLVFAFMALFVSCSKESKFDTIDNFDINLYTGKWYEIARLEHRFEKGLNNVTAIYSLNEDGTVKVLNRGFDYEKKQWKEAQGKAKFKETQNIGKLKVSFFGPFYADYNILALDENYQHALISGNDTQYLWILSREKIISEEVKNKYLELAQSLDFQISELIWVEHNQ